MRVLFVCLGNICRSPLGEGIFRDLVQTRWGPEAAEMFEIDSAGTGGYHVGDPPDSRARSVAHRHGIDISAQRARKFQANDLERFDFVFAMDRNNLQEIRRLKTKVCTARLCLLRDFDPHGGDDVPDPYYGGPDGFDEVFEIVRRSCRNFLEKHADDVQGGESS